MNEIITFGMDLCKKLFDRYSDDYLNKLVKLFEDNNTVKMLTAKALEGEEGKELNRELKLLVRKAYEGTDKVDSANFEENVREDFEMYLKELSEEEDFDKSMKEALFQRYKIFVEGYRDYIGKQITIGEKCILKEIGRVERKQFISFEDIQKSLKEQSSILCKLNEDKKIPFIDISSIYVEVEKYDSKYEFLGNRFKLTETNISYEEDDDIYIFTVYIKNIGKRLIEKIRIDNFNVALCREGEDLITGYYICNIIEHCGQPVECNLNLMSESEQKIHFIVKDTRDEIYKENIDLGYHYDEEFNNDRLRIQFDMELESDGNVADYHYYIFASRNRGEYDNIVGDYSVDYVGMEKNIQ